MLRVQCQEAYIGRQIPGELCSFCEYLCFQHINAQPAFASAEYSRSATCLQSLVGGFIERSGTLDEAGKMKQWYAVQQLTRAPLSASELAAQWEAHAAAHGVVHGGSRTLSRTPSAFAAPGATPMQIQGASVSPSAAQGQLNAEHIMRCIRSCEQSCADASSARASISADGLQIGCSRISKPSHKVTACGRISSSAVPHIICTRHW